MERFFNEKEITPFESLKQLKEFLGEMKQKLIDHGFNEIVVDHYSERSINRIRELKLIDTNGNFFPETHPFVIGVVKDFGRNLIRIKEELTQE